MRLKLTRLVLITCGALLGIIALQVFWLVKANNGQQEKLSGLADNVLMETQILTGVNASLRTAAGSLVQEVLHSIKENVLDTAAISGAAIRSEYLIVGDSDVKQQVLNLLGMDSASRKNFTVTTYKERLQQSFHYKNVTIPFELALIDSAEQIIACTTDTVSFHQIPMKTGFALSLPVTLNPQQTGRIQLAFPHVTFYLLKGMGLILLLSLLFISVCAFSFSYMVTLFYRQKKVAEIKNDFMNNITHELKTPISSVSVALELLRDDSVPVSRETRDEYFSIADNELKRLSLLVDKVLRMAAFEKMQVKIACDWFAVQPWIALVLQSVKPLSEAGKANIVVTVQPENMQFYADKNQMSSVLQNLLENALKYADPDKPEVQIQVAAYADAGFFHIKVADNGIGIPQQYQQRIFEKFFRVPTGDEHETKGYGLGLSYVNEIVQLHKGTIQVISEWRKSTIFTVSIPKKI